MAKKRGTKRSLAALPKGLPVRKKTKNGANPFEAARVVKGGREKHMVHNRPTSLSKAASGGQSALARSLARRKEGLQQSLLQEKKANSFIDRRIGEHSSEVTHDEKMLARIVRERSRRSKKTSKYQLDDADDDDNGGVLTHKVRRI
jgi:nucleolar protein 14